MPKVISIHQPNYLPWLGFFYKMYKSDYFVFYDNIQIEHRSQQAYVNRTKIKTNHGELWLTCPIHIKPGKLIQDVELVKTINWRKKHLKTLYYNYNRSKYFSQVYPAIENLITQGSDNLCEFNIAIINWIIDYLDIPVKVLRASEIPIIETNPTLRLIKIIESVGADVYFSGNGAKLYQQEEMFEEHGIELRYTNFRQGDYLQCFSGFIPRLSVIDALFNLGKETSSLLKQ